jgi:hypothetical protein
MAFNIWQHILDHAQKVIDNLVNHNDPSKLVHFNTSVATAYFINAGYTTQEEIDTVMENILDGIANKVLKVKEKNGTYLRKKDNILTQKYRTRKIKFDSILSAYHNRHFDNTKSVNPHFHFLFPKKARMGRGYVYLKQALEEEATKYNIKFNFMEDKRETGLTQRENKNLENFSWHMHQGDTAKIDKYLNVGNASTLKKHIDTLVTHYAHSQNISYFLKVMKLIHQRLEENDIDFHYTLENDETINLKEDIFFFLTDTQKYKIEELCGDYNIDIDMNNVLDREILKYAHGFRSEAMDILVDKFDITEIVPMQLNLLNSDESSLKNAVKKKNTFRPLVIEDIHAALEHAENEKDFKQRLLDTNAYTKVVINSKKTGGKRIKDAFTLTTAKNMQITISFRELGLNWSQITKMMMDNKKSNQDKNNDSDESKEKPAVSKSKIIDYEKPVSAVKPEALSQYQYNMKLLLSLYPKEVTRMSAEDRLEYLKSLAKNNNIEHSNLYNITTISNDSSTIADYDSKIKLVKTDAIDSSISDMLDIAHLKGWELSTLTLKGSETFKEKTRAEIARRTGVNPDGARRKKPKKKRMRP